MLTTEQVEALKEIYGFNTVKIYGPYLDSDNRRILHINMDGKNRCRQLAAWLAEIKYGRRMIRGETVDHIDEDKTNDSINNLQILTQKENAIKAFKNGKYNDALKKMKISAKSELNSIRHLGDKNPLSKISNKEVKKYRELFQERKISIKQIVKETGIERRAVENFIMSRSYKNAGGPLIYPKSHQNPEIIIKATALINQKVPYIKIAEILGIDRSTLRSRLKKAGVLEQV